MIHRTHVLIALGLVATLALVFQNCGQGFVVATSSSNKGSDTLSSTTDPTAPQATELFKVTGSAPPQMKLGTQQAIAFSVTPMNGFTGGVDLSFDAKALAAFDPTGNVKFALDQTHLSLGGSQATVVNLSFTVPTATPTLNTSIDIIATESNPPGSRAAFKATIRVPVQVTAVYEVMLGGPAAAQETWSPPKTVSFAQHPGGIRVRFINSSTVAHRIHATGPIPHQPGNLAPGAVYEFVVMGQNRTSTTYYCHNHENAGAAARQLAFNAFAPAPTPTMSGNPDAKFSYLAANILPKCTSCHSAGAAAAGIDLTSYASTTSSIAIVVPGNAAASGLYVETANASMPLGAPALSAAEIKAIQDWINDGALNN